MMRIPVWLYECCFTDTDVPAKTGTRYMVQEYQATAVSTPLCSSSVFAAYVS